MKFYLITEGDHYLICLVKCGDNEFFINKCAEKILARSNTITDLLIVFNKALNKESLFSVN